MARTNVNFKEYYEITVGQTLDHAKPGAKFNQRIYLGLQDYNAPTVVVTDGYAIDYASKPDYSNELAGELRANMVLIEHRFFGESVPDSLDWRLLTMKQAAADCHLIKTMLGQILTGKWLATGISKGGQAALSYKMFYPQDICASVVYGAAVKSKPTVFTDTVLSGLAQTSCGKKISEVQSFLFRQKSVLLPLFSGFSSQKKYDYAPLDDETVLDYLLLELPFSFWQNGHACLEIPDTTDTPENLLNYLVKVVPPRFFTAKNKKQAGPAFYMFYHELGYYEYAVGPFAEYLKRKDYPNNYFAPAGTAIQFDSSFQQRANAFMQSDSARCVFLIYGQNDPWALQSTVSGNVFVVPGGSHKSRIGDFPAERQAEIYVKIRACLK